MDPLHKLHRHGASFLRLLNENVLRMRNIVAELRRIWAENKDQASDRSFVTTVGISVAAAGLGLATVAALFTNETRLLASAVVIAVIGCVAAARLFRASSVPCREGDNNVGQLTEEFTEIVSTLRRDIFTMKELCEKLLQSQNKSNSEVQKLNNITVKVLEIAAALRTSSSVAETGNVADEYDSVVCEFEKLSSQIKSFG